jgi:hypothetical protein
VSASSVEQNIYSADATIQDSQISGENLYLVTNAPDKLDILSVNENEISFESSITTGFENPISFTRVGNFGYVTNWGDISTAFGPDPDSFLSIVDLSSNDVVDSIALDVRPQNIIAVNSRLYIANEGASTVSVFNADGVNTTRITDIQVPFGPSTAVLDADGDLWVLCVSGALVELDLMNNSVKTTIEGLTVGGFDEKMDINGSGTRLYFLGGNNVDFTGLTTVYQVDLTQPNPVATLFDDDGFALYGIGVDPETGEVFIGDSNAFQSTGTGFQYDTDGNQLRQFATGIGPNSFVFL